MGKLYTVSVDGGMPASAGRRHGRLRLATRPTASSWPINRKAQAYWRKYYRGAYQSDVTVDGPGREEVHRPDRFRRDGLLADVGARRPHLLRQRPRRQRPDQHLARPRSGRQGRARHRLQRAATCAGPSISADGKTIVFEHDFGIWKLDVASRRASRPSSFDIAAETQENLTEVRDFNSQVDDYDLAPDWPPHRLLDPRRDLHRAVEEGDLRQITDGPCARPRRRVLARRQVDRLCLRPQRARGDLRRRRRRRGRAAEDHRSRRAQDRPTPGRPTRRQIAFTASDGKLRKSRRRRQETQGTDHVEATATSARPPGRPTASGSPTRSPTCRARPTST